MSGTQGRHRGPRDGRATGGGVTEAGCSQAHLRYGEPEPLPVLRVYRGSMILGVVMRGSDGLWYVGMAGLMGYPSFATDTDAIAYLADGGPSVVEVVEPA